MTNVHISDPNKLLAALPKAEFQRIEPHLEFVELKRGQILYEFEEHLIYAMFPTTAVASLTCNMEDGTSAEVAVVGNEGVLGVSTFMGADSALTQCLIQHTGHAYRLKASVLKAEFDHCGGLQHVLLQYTASLIAQMAQTTGCYRRHTVLQQLCRWLLLNADRLPDEQIHMTQEVMATMLGVRRESVTEAAGKLQEAGLITYYRGHIEILNRPLLEAEACECYDIVRRQYDALLETLSVKAVD